MIKQTEKNLACGHKLKISSLHNLKWDIRQLKLFSSSYIDIFDLDCLNLLHSCNIEQTSIKYDKKKVMVKGEFTTVEIRSFFCSDTFPLFPGE